MSGRAKYKGFYQKVEPQPFDANAWAGEPKTVGSRHVICVFRCHPFVPAERQGSGSCAARAPMVAIVELTMDGSVAGMKATDVGIRSSTPTPLHPRQVEVWGLGDR